VSGAKLVTKEDKEKLDEWYVRNASLWVDLQIALMTIKVIVKGRVSSEEILADTEQVRSRNIGLERTNTG
jgi:lipopolysaccharide/colanic/teichoic acid biosynthesis glycosyltransferase